MKRDHELVVTIQLADVAGHGERTAWVIVKGECLRLNLPEVPKSGLVFHWHGGPWRLVHVVEGIWIAEAISQ